MNNKQFRQTSKELPSKPGHYEARALFGNYPVYFDGKDWYSVSGDKTPVSEWREV